jgi:hypothetical protein
MAAVRVRMVIVLPAKRLALTAAKIWNKYKIIHFSVTVQRKMVTLLKFQCTEMPKCLWHNCEMIRKIILQQVGCVFAFIMNCVLTVICAGVLSDVSGWWYTAFTHLLPTLLELLQCSYISCYCVYCVCVRNIQDLYTKSWSDKPWNEYSAWKT